MEALLPLLGGLALIVGITLYSSLSWGYVCLKFWYWFMLPVFTELPHVTFWQAVGLMLFISLFKNHSAKENDEDKVNWWIFVLSPWLTLIVGYFFRP